MTRTTKEVNLEMCPDKMPPSGDQEISDMLFAQRISYDSGVPVGGVLALTRRISALEARIRVLEMQKNWTRPDAEYRTK